MEGTPTPEGRNRFNEERFKRFVKFFEDGAKAAQKNAQLSEALLAHLADPKNGLIAAIDDLIDEIRGLRQDLRVVAKVRKGEIALGELIFDALGVGRRGR